MTSHWPVWRSMLFVPSHVEKFVSSAHRQNADAYILDLEDSVPPAYKSTARTAVTDAATSVAPASMVSRRWLRTICQLSSWRAYGP